MVRISQDYASDLRQLADIRTLIEGVCRQAWHLPCESQGGREERLLHELQLAVQEAATNVIRHAHRGEKGEPLRVDVDASEDQLTVILHYHGAAFDPSLVAPPCFDGSRTGGFGVYLIQNLVDAVAYFRDEAGQCAVRMQKQRHKDQPSFPRSLRSRSTECTMQITVDKVGNVAIVTPHLTQLDASNADDFKQAVGPVLDETKKLILDLKKVQFVDSSGCGAILSCLKHLTEGNGDLALCNVNNHVRTVFELIRLHRICQILATRDDAIQALTA